MPPSNSLERRTYELLRITLPRTPVNKGSSKGCVSLPAPSNYPLMWCRLLATGSSRLLYIRQRAIGARSQPYGVPAGCGTGSGGAGSGRALLRRRLPLRHIKKAMMNPHTANRRRPTSLTMSATKPS
jgi:hypothetical protein